jgi:hypothetical protein
MSEEKKTKKENPDAIKLDPKYDPRTDPGPERIEDADGVQDDTPTSAKEVPLEDSRKDDTSVLATDQFDAEGNRIN